MRKPLLSRVCGLVLTLCSVLMLAGVSLVLPASVGAYATAGAAPVPGSPGLPDGRVYEEVSPANKPGTQAAPEDAGRPGVIWAAAGGNSAAFNSSGPMGDAPSGVELYTVARRSAGGWESYGATPHSLGVQNILANEPETIGFSADLTKSIFQARGPFAPGQPEGEEIYDGEGIFDGYVYDIGTGPTAWLGNPLISNPLSGATGYNGTFVKYGQIAGASSDLGTVYFSFYGTLTPEDNVPNASLGDVSRAQVVEREGGAGRGGAGFYEWHEGRLSSAGVLPDGLLDPYGAERAGYPEFEGGAAQDPEMTQDQVSEDGGRAFFVSPDPFSNHPASDVPELYVRETAADGTQSTVLVSRDLLLPPVNGLPAAAPHGPLAFGSPNTSLGTTPDSYVWATPDGSRAFFLSADQLTAEAPADDSGKLYEFNLETNTLTYLRGATAPTTEPAYPSGAAVLAASRDGSRLLFAKLVHEGNTEIATELDLWTDGPEGPGDGQITPIAPLNITEKSTFEPDFAYTRAASDGSAFVFETKEAFPGFHFNNGGGFVDQVYRYEVATNSLSCLSCPPAGVTPSGDADLSTVHDTLSPTPLDKDRGISEDGDRVFFDTPDPLVPWDTNTAPPVAAGHGSGKLAPRGYDVYEWENGRLFLISTGKSDENSFVGDNSANGDDAFFSTAEGLVPGDTDGGYDVYDARVPHPGDNPPPSAVPCEGDVCQGPPSVPSLLGAPASATFSGLGNPVAAVSAPAPAVKAKQQPKKKVKKKAKKKKASSKKGKKSGSKVKGKG